MDGAGGLHKEKRTIPTLKDGGDGIMLMVRVKPD